MSNVSPNSLMNIFIIVAGERVVNTIWTLPSRTRSRSAVRPNKIKFVDYCINLCCNVCRLIDLLYNILRRR